MNPKLVIGIGTGRCGTLSLATLLSAQLDVHVGHESRPLLPWNPKDATEDIVARFETLQKRHQRARLVGDVAFYYLNYVPILLEHFPDVKVVCLRRSLEGTIESYDRWVSQHHGDNVDNWRQDRQGLQSNEWTPCYPKFPVSNRRDGIRAYWKTYYQTVEQLAQAYPGAIRVFEMSSLNRVNDIRQILNFVGIIGEQAQVRVVHMHQSGQETPARQSGE
ncbi:MAG: hypothetical protein GC159_17720 [Phycisphaera sp.]|nr:hypothetical protein [Phycisphaera sp.]